MPSPNHRTGIALALACLTVTASACAAATPTVIADGDAEEVSAPALPAPVGDQRGAILDDQPFTAAKGSFGDLDVQSRKILYRSTSGIDGSGTEVSGTVFIPSGQPPAGGEPIVSVGHGTTGIYDSCAPSRHSDLLSTIGLVAQLIAAGYVVAVTDYQGLGTPGLHPYLEPKSAAYNIIDAARAARIIAPTASPRWIALGVSQGGQGSWAAGEYNTDYGDGLALLGTANLSPAADLSGVVQPGVVAPLDLPPVLVPYLISGLGTLHPELKERDYVHGELQSGKDVLLSCTSTLLPRKDAILKSLGPADTQPNSVHAADRLHGWLQQLALPKQSTQVPILVVYGQKDDIIKPSWIHGAVTRACALGDTIQEIQRTGEGHADPKSVDDALRWIADRFASRAPTDTCHQ